MAGRIRSIKPEILEDEKTAALSHLEWRLFVSLWLLADDHGALRADPAYLSGQIFWGCPVTPQDMTDAIEGLAAVSLVQIYEVRGQRYLQITNWSKHQRVDHPGKPRVPRLGDDGAWPVASRRSDRVYFIRATESRAIKIGVSWNPSRRLASLQAGHHERLELLAEVPGDVHAERALHREFAGSRMSGEWFSETQQLLDRIHELTLSAGIADTPHQPEREPSRDIPRTIAPDLRSSTSDHDREHPPARAIPDTVPEQTLRAAPPPAPILLPAAERIEIKRRLIGRAWTLGGEAFARIQASGIDPTAPNGWAGMPDASSPPMEDLRAILDGLLVGERPDAAAAEAKIANRVAVAEAEARAMNPPSARYMTPARIWNRKSFAIAVDLSPLQVTPRAGPRGSAERATKKLLSNTTGDEPDLDYRPR